MQNGGKKCGGDLTRCEDFVCQTKERRWGGLKVEREWERWGGKEVLLCKIYGEEGRSG